MSSARSIYGRDSICGLGPAHRTGIDRAKSWPVTMAHLGPDPDKWVWEIWWWGNVGLELSTPTLDKSGLHYSRHNLKSNEDIAPASIYLINWRRLFTHKSTSVSFAMSCTCNDISFFIFFAFVLLYMFVCADSCQFHLWHFNCFPISWKFSWKC